jgi:hypothetical protein
MRGCDRVLKGRLTASLESGETAGCMPSLAEAESALGRNGVFCSPAVELAFVGFEGSERAQPWFKQRATQNIAKAEKDRRDLLNLVIEYMVARLSDLQ